MRTGMRESMVCVLGLSFLISFAGVLFAQETQLAQQPQPPQKAEVERNWYFRIGTGDYFITDDVSRLHYEGGRSGPFFAIGRSLSRNFAVEGMLVADLRIDGKDNIERRESGGVVEYRYLSVKDINISSGWLFSLRACIPGKAVEPYLLGGIGLYDVETVLLRDQESTHTEVGYHAAAGLQFRLSERFFLYGEYLQLWLRTTVPPPMEAGLNLNGYVVSGGAGIRF